MMSLVYMLLAVIGLGFLIFIHELGHYWMAKRVGMRVETFAIGFGKPIYSWMKDGTKWQLGWLPFGGYVKIAGTDTEGTTDPYEVSDGFYGKGPWNRIKVAFMGPLVNLVFAFLVFGLLWTLGGREKTHTEVTSKIGWVDPNSELFNKGVRPGDEITAYDNRPFQGAKDHLYAAMMGSKEIIIKGNHDNYSTGEKTPFEYAVSPYQHPLAFDKGRTTLGIMAPANYIIYTKLPDGQENPLPSGSPLTNSGIQYGDRIVWVDGEVIFSALQLENVLNDGRSLLTIQRGDKDFLVRVPRVYAEEIKFDPEFKEELIDWQFEADLQGTKSQKLYVIPYNLTNDTVVENELLFIDPEKQKEAFAKISASAVDQPLLAGDKIIAIDGIAVEKSYELLKHLQSKKVNIIVQRDPSAIQKTSSKNSDLDFETHLNTKDIESIANTIGTDHQAKEAGQYILLNPVEPKKSSDFVKSDENTIKIAQANKEWEETLKNIEDPEKRSYLSRLRKEQDNKLLLGIPYTDKKVSYNPSPLELFQNVFDEIVHTLEALFSGALNPKWLSGPVGIVQVVQNTWMVSAKEALFWIGAISLNLGVLNLLPIPVLDGGTIMLSLFELVTGRRIHPKTLEKIVLPFAILLITFFVFVTYHDVLRLFGGLWR